MYRNLVIKRQIVLKMNQCIVQINTHTTAHKPSIRIVFVWSLHLFSNVRPCLLSISWHLHKHFREMESFYCSSFLGSESGKYEIHSFLFMIYFVSIPHIFSWCLRLSLSLPLCLFGVIRDHLMKFQMPSSLTSDTRENLIKNMQFFFRIIDDDDLPITLCKSYHHDSYITSMK